MAAPGIWIKNQRELLLLDPPQKNVLYFITTLVARQACESKEGKAGHFTCTPDGQLECFEGWIGDLCNVPICKKG
jgi:hypothetical protein